MIKVSLLLILYYIMLVNNKIGVDDCMFKKP